ncbi:MAG TPA: 23S rRNA (uracil-5-)-methyltransferase RumA, partial [Acidobacteria bacterium]|nr:23S rRNA (uracil-5-)-methyltransferase RumA [Acidobacteriota bacterium]
GLSREVLTRLARARPDRVVYVSCDVATQARDLRALGLQDYCVTRVRAFDMFPNTPHVETVVLLERGGSPG